ncbi:NAP1-related protein 1 [Striga asiatica]|uniref:NAP1-related protein 1 n=1 Tax=Striga asiatica TaxID=4170 RepID=A0A5A7P2L9_STRAF|nr:NAP1-related protein 1 [Striga asiatica]
MEMIKQIIKQKHQIHNTSNALIRRKSSQRIKKSTTTHTLPFVYTAWLGSMETEKEKETTEKLDLWDTLYSIGKAREKVLEVEQKYNEVRKPELSTDEDQKIFKYLKVEDCKDLFTFHFKLNPYFEDTKLTKTFAFLEEGTTKITTTSIKWKEGMGIPNGTAEVKKGNKLSHFEESLVTLKRFMMSWDNFYTYLQYESIAKYMPDIEAELFTYTTRPQQSN